MPFKIYFFIYKFKAVFMKILSIILVFLCIGCTKEIEENSSVEWDGVFIHDGYTKIVCETYSVIDTSNTILEYGKLTFFNNGKYTQTGFTVFEKDVELKWSSDSTSLKLDRGEGKFYYIFKLISSNFNEKKYRVIKFDIDVPSPCYIDFTKGESYLILTKP